MATRDRERLKLTRVRRYYSARSGQNPKAGRLDLPSFKKLFLAVFNDLENRELLQEMLGKNCVDDQEPPVGKAGIDVPLYVLRKVRKDNLWPIARNIEKYTEEDVFDIIEFLFDHVSLGVSGWTHQWNGCGIHFDTFDRIEGQRIYRNEINELLLDYGDGFELTPDGEIAHIAEAGFANLVVAGLPSEDAANVDNRVRGAIRKYLNRGSSLDDRRDAVRSLVDVLEFLRPQISKVLNKKDEADLFNIANNFAVRHHNPKQQSDYDPNIWVSWMFYFYLATIHAAQRLIERARVEYPTEIP